MNPRDQRIMLKLLPEGLIVLGPEKAAFDRCSFVAVVVPLSKQFGHFPVFVGTIEERVRRYDTPTTFGSKI